MKQNSTFVGHYHLLSNTKKLIVFLSIRDKMVSCDWILGDKKVIGPLRSKGSY